MTDTMSVIMPDGTQIDGVPVGTPKAEILAKYQASQAKPPGILGTAMDALHAIPGGLAQGVAGVAGMGGDIREALASHLPQGLHDAVTAVGRVLPLTLGGGNTSAEYNAALSAPTGGYYKPQTTTGRIAETAASYVPAAVGGEAGLPALGARLLSRAVVPAAGTVLGGDAADAVGMPRGVGELAGTVGGSLVGGLHLPKPGAVAPTIDELKTAARAAYQAVDNSGMLIAKPAVQRLVGTVKASLANMGIHPALQPRAMAVLGALENAAGNNQTLQGMEILKRIANQAAQGTIDKSDKMMARVIGDHIDDFVQSLSPSDVIGKVDQPAVTALGTARDLWARASKGQIIEDTIAKAQNNARSMKANFSALGTGDALRTAFRQLSNNARAMSRFSSNERDAILKVAQGGPLEQVLRIVGKLSPDQAIPMITEGAGALAHPSLALGTAAAGLGGKIASNAITSRNARLASELMRNGAPLGPPKVSAIQAIGQIKPDKLAAMLMTPAIANSRQGVH